MERTETIELISFLAVAEAGSFRQAASKLDVGQSAISRRIQKLEDRLGVSLFERRTVGVRLTIAGTCFAARAKAILDEVDTAVNLAKSAGRAEIGVLRIGLVASLSRGPIRRIIGSFLGHHPNVELCVSEADRSELFIKMSHRELDVVIAIGEHSQNGTDMLVMSKERIYLALSKDHTLSDRDGLSWRDVENAEFIVSTKDAGPEFQNYITRRLSGLGKYVHFRRHKLGREGVMAMVGLGLGVTVVAENWLGVRYPNVTFIPVGEATETLPFCLYWKSANDNPALRRFISLARVEARRNYALS